MEGLRRRQAWEREANSPLESAGCCGERGPEGRDGGRPGALELLREAVLAGVLN